MAGEGCPLWIENSNRYKVVQVMAILRNPLTIRSFYVSWAQAVREGERLLENLARWTNLNAIELTNYDADWGPRNRQVASLVFPSAAPFKGLGLRLTTKERFDTLQRFMESARSKGFDVVCNFAPLYANSEKFVPMACVDVTGLPVPGLNNLPAYGCPNNPDVLRLWSDHDPRDGGEVVLGEPHSRQPRGVPILGRFFTAPDILLLLRLLQGEGEGSGAGPDSGQTGGEDAVRFASLRDRPRASVPRPISPNDVLNYLGEAPEHRPLAGFPIATRCRSTSRPS